MDSTSDGSNSIDLPMIDFPLSPQVFDEACRELGYTKISARTMMANATVGEAIKKLGVVKLGRSTLLLANDSLDSMISYCGELLGKASTTDELRLETLKVAGSLISRKIVT